MNIRNIAARIGMDYEEALEDYCGDVAALSERLESFPCECHIEDLESAVESGSEEDARREAKRIRKLAEKAGLATLRDRCHELERSERESWQAELASIKALCSEIISVIEGEK